MPETVVAIEPASAAQVTTLAFLKRRRGAGLFADAWQRHAPGRQTVHSLTKDEAGAIIDYLARHR